MKRQPIRRHHVRNRRGIYALTVTFVILGLTILLGGLGNVARHNADHVALQNSADATAYSVAVVRARGLNTATALNHLSGELTALLVLHEAIAGAKGTTSYNSEVWQQRNRMVSTALLIDDGSMRPLLSQLQQESDWQNPRVAATLFDVRMRLKQFANLAAVANAAGTILQGIPVVQAFGIALKIGARVLAVKVVAEWRVTGYLQTLADTLVPARGAIEVMLTAVDTLQKSLHAPAAMTPSLQQLDELLTKANGGRHTYFPPLEAALPIKAEADPDNQTRSDIGGPPPDKNFGGGAQDAIAFINEPVAQIKRMIGWADDLFVAATEAFPIPDRWKEDVDGLRGKGRTAIDELLNALTFDGNENHADNPTWELFKEQYNWQWESLSQWTRATYPYVDSWRRPLLSAMNHPLLGLMLGNGSNYYGRWSSRLTVYRSVQLRKDGRAMSILVDSTRDSKGQEPWRRQSQRIDFLFGSTVIADTPVRRTLASSVLKTPPIDRYYATAQALVYNANEPASGDGTQPHVGWDTLAWRPSGKLAPEYPFVSMPPRARLLSLDFLRRPEPVSVQLNWQAVLVPVRSTNFALAVGLAEADVREDLTPAVPLHALLNHH